MEEKEVRLDAQLCIHCSKQLLWYLWRVGVRSSKKEGVLSSRK
jgi:hypothetical protein